jgi:hypothetical protein
MLTRLIKKGLPRMLALGSGAAAPTHAEDPFSVSGQAGSRLAGDVSCPRLIVGERRALEQSRSDMREADGSKRVRIGLLYVFMCVGGPLLWGAWMVFRLELLSPGDYVRCLLSPLTLAVLALFLAGNLINVSRAARARARKGALDIRRILRAHCAALVAFGTVGTLIFLMPLSARAPGAGAASAGDWLSTAAIGALSGASLVFLVYGYFTVAIFRLITGSAEILRSLRRFYSTLFPLGAALFVTAAALAGRLQVLTALGGVSLLLPLATAGFLYVRTMIRTGAARGGVTHAVE